MNAMAVLFRVDLNKQESDFATIQNFLEKKGIWHDRWKTTALLDKTSSQDEILAAYKDVLEPFMKHGGYQVADVINVTAETEGLPAIRSKFLREHTHTEDEVRFFVDGQGLFWFNIKGEVFSLLCQSGDLISVPANTNHWFDLGPEPNVKAIRIFIDTAGWVPHYTLSGIDELYNPKY